MKHTSSTLEHAGISSSWIIRTRRSANAGVSICRKRRSTTLGCAWMNASIWGRTASGHNLYPGTRDAIHLCRLFSQERCIDFRKVGGHDHLSFHVLRRTVEYCLPKWPQELVRVRDARLDDRPDIAAKHLGGNIGVSERGNWYWNLGQRCVQRRT